MRMIQRGYRRCRRRRPCGPGRRSGTPRAGGGGRTAASGDRRARGRGSSASIPRPAASATSSRIGTISGGSETICGLPSTISRELRERPHAVLASAPSRSSFSAAFACFVLDLGPQLGCDRLGVEPRVPDVEVAHRREAAHRLAVGAQARSGLPSFASASEKSRSRPAISKLAARRFTSHSNGPGSVSSKSFTSNTSERSGEAKPPKLERCASPHSCTRQARARRRREVAGHDCRRPAVERERRDQHPAVADRHELGHATCSLVLEHAHRVTVGVGVEHRVARAGCLGARCAASRDAVGLGWLLCDRGSLHVLVLARHLIAGVSVGLHPDGHEASFRRHTTEVAVAGDGATRHHSVRLGRPRDHVDEHPQERKVRSSHR